MYNHFQLLQRSKTNSWSLQTTSKIDYGRLQPSRTINCQPHQPSHLSTLTNCHRLVPALTPPHLRPPTALNNPRQPSPSLNSLHQSSPALVNALQCSPALKSPRTKFCHDCLTAFPTGDPQVWTMQWQPPPLAYEAKFGAAQLFHLYLCLRHRQIGKNFMGISDMLLSDQGLGHRPSPPPTPHRPFTPDNPMVC